MDVWESIAVVTTGVALEWRERDEVEVEGPRIHCLDSSQ